MHGAGASQGGRSLGRAPIGRGRGALRDVRQALVVCALTLVAAIVSTLILAGGAAAAPPDPFTIDKQTSTPSFDAVGDIISYTYTVAYSGGGVSIGRRPDASIFDGDPIANLHVVDDKVSSVACDLSTVGNGDDRLDPGETVVCTGSYTVIQADLDAGFVTNTADAEGDLTDCECEDSVATAPDSVTVNAIRSPALALVKSVAETSYAAVGDTLHYTYVATNSGNVTLTSAITVADDKVDVLSSVDCNGLPVGGLPPGGAVDCTASYVVTQADVDLGKVTNHATAHSGSTVSNQASVTVNGRRSAALALDKRSPDATFSQVGQILSYTYVVTNSGGSTITQAITVSDDLIAHVSCPSLPVGGLLPGHAIVCSATYSVTQADLDAGSVVNIAIASAGSLKSNTDSVTITRDNDQLIKTTIATIQNFLRHRIDLLASEEPDRPRYLRRFTGSLWDQGAEPGAVGNAYAPFDFSMAGDSNNGSVDFATSLGQISDYAATAAVGKGAADAVNGLAGHGAAKHDGVDVWVEGHYSAFDDEVGGSKSSGKFGVVYLGADYPISSSTIVGALAQFDWMNDVSTSLGTDVTGSGWMAGPYVSTRLTENLFFDARVAWGTSDNTLDAPGISGDNFSTERWLARANLTGNWQNGPWRFTPSASIAYIQENQKSYIDGYGLTIPSQTASLGRFTIGPEIAYRWLAADGTAIEPHVSLTGVWDFAHEGSLTSLGTVIDTGDIRGRVEAGVLVSRPSGETLRLVGTFDGIGTDMSIYGGQIWLNFPFH